MSEKRVIEQHAREVHFAGIEPTLSHVAGTDISSPVTLTPAPSGSNMLIMQSQDQDAYYTLDGSSPVATGGVVGFLLKADDPPIAIPVGAVSVVRVIQGAATARFQYQWTL